MGVPRGHKTRSRVYIYTVRPTLKDLSFDRATSVHSFLYTFFPFVFTLQPLTVYKLALTSNILMSIIQDLSQKSRELWAQIKLAKSQEELVEIWHLLINVFDAVSLNITKSSPSLKSDAKSSCNTLSRRNFLTTILNGRRSKLTL